MKKTLLGLLVLAVVGWLFVPAGAPATVAPAEARPFLWDQDRLWSRLEAQFVATRDLGCAGANQRIDAQLITLTADVAWLAGGDRSPADQRFDLIEERLFAVAPLVAACPAHVAPMLDIVNRLRSGLKRNSRNWDVRDAASRERVYRILYGARMAIEEILLQSKVAEVPDLVIGTDVPSQAPSVVVNGLRVHSGDILVSRGGAPVSALIARGNDYPGNFSHIAILHVSPEQDVSVIEAHIEVGVTVSTLEQYLADTKLRLMVLRLDDSLDELQADPLLAHRAATAALAEALHPGARVELGFAPYRPGVWQHSEVASAPYGDLGVKLWEGLTTMSASGTAAWLAALGVEQFETHGPSDLEYDPKVVVVAEWRDPDALFDDHVDNAVIDAMLEGAEQGDTIEYDYRYLPVARLMKAYSALLNSLGRHGPVPEGMAATTALRSQWLSERHAAIKADVLRQVEAFRAEHGYVPPYWQLLAMARDGLAAAE